MTNGLLLFCILHIDLSFSVPPHWPIGQGIRLESCRPGFDSLLHQDFSGLSHTSDLKIGTPVATLPAAWHYTMGSALGLSGLVSVYCDWVR